VLAGKACLPLSYPECTVMSGRLNVIEAKMKKSTLSVLKELDI
jgi:hypothetical protein